MAPVDRVTEEVAVKPGRLGVFLKGPRTGLVARVRRAIILSEKRGEMKNGLLWEGQGIPYGCGL